MIKITYTKNVKISKGQSTVIKRQKAEKINTQFISQRADFSVAKSFYKSIRQNKKVDKGY